MVFVFLKLFNLQKLFLFVESNLLILKHFSGRIVSFFLPSFFFYKLSLKESNVEQLKLVFLKRFFFISFLAHFFNFYKQLFSIFFLKIKIRGLGYRIRGLSFATYSFFFNYTNYYYFFAPRKLLIKQYRKRMLLITFSWFLLKLILSQIYC